MWLSVLLLLVGFAILIQGADWLVQGASALAKKFQVSDLAIGLTIVAFGTSAPELVINGLAAFENNQGIVLGNVIGSNVFNLFAIAGVAALIYPMAVQPSTVWKEIPISAFAALLTLWLANDWFTGDSTPELSFVDGLILMSGFLLFLGYVYREMQKSPVVDVGSSASLPVYRIILYIIVGLLGLVGGGKLVVDHAVSIAQILGISEKVIGLTIVAAGTSLPELATSIVAAMKKNNDIAIGNIIGSNIFNLFLILSISVLIRPLQYDQAFNFELVLLLAGTLLLFLMMFTGKRYRLDRWEGFIMLSIYLAYMAYLLYNALV